MQANNKYTILQHKIIKTTSINGIEIKIYYFILIASVINLM